MTRKYGWESGDAADFLKATGADPEGIMDMVWPRNKTPTSGDKSELFGPGPWQSDADRFDGVDPETQLTYHVRRMMTPYQGHLCGYVESPHHEGKLTYDRYDWCYVHGGVTFCDTITEFGEGKVFVGFDCAHSFDVVPGMPEDTHMPGAKYRDMAFVKAECLMLAAQLNVKPENRKAAFQSSGESEADDES